MLKLTTFFIFAYSFIAYTENWGQWRGPQSDSKSSEIISATADLSKTTWTASVGEGYSAVSVHDHYLLTAGKVKKKEILHCLNAKTGKVVWQHNYATVESKRYPGSRSTPVTDGTTVFMISRTAKLMALHLKDGKMKWTVDLTAELAKVVPHWGFSSSVVIDGDILYLNAGDQGVAFNKKTGKSLWDHKLGSSSYSTPVLFSHKDKKFIALFTTKGLTILNKTDGTEVTSYAWKSKRGANSTDPVISKDGSRIFISDTTATPSACLLDFDGKTLTKNWGNSELKSHFSTPLLIDNTLYGANGRTGKAKLVALDFLTGKLLWSSKEKFGSAILASDTIVYLDERGNLSLIKPNRTKLELVKQQRVLDKGKCWTMPIIANGHLYCRNDRGTLICIKVKDN